MTNATHTTPPAAAPLGAVLLFTGLNSYATGTTFNGVSFITNQAFGFGPMQNALLGLLLGVTYIVGALGTARFVRWMHAGGKGVSSRGVLAWLMVVAAGLNMLPVTTWAFMRDSHPAVAMWSMVAFIGCYSMLSGALWPIVEAFLSGARRGDQLRHAIGLFNVTWAGALVIGLVVVSPLMKVGVMLPLGAVAAVHLASMLCLVRLPAEPGEHLFDAPHDVPERFERLLRVHRVLLPTCYMVMYAMIPLLPSITARVGIGDELRTTFASIWLAGRVAAFLILQAWKGWRGTWLTAVWGPALLLCGFALTVLSPMLGEGRSNVAGLACAGVGLFAFGVGAACIYTGALYYAMEVSQAHPEAEGTHEAGGTHEAMIGLGYTIGPICTLVPTVLSIPGLFGNSEQSPISPTWVDPMIVGLVAILAACAIVLAVRMGNRARPARYP